MGKTTLDYLEIPTLDGGVEILDMRDFVSKEEFEGSVSIIVEKINSTISFLSSKVDSLSKECELLKKERNDRINAFRIVSCEEGNVLSFGENTAIGQNLSSLEFSKDGFMYYDLGNNESITLNAKEALYIRCKENMYMNQSQYPIMETTKEFEVEGKVLNLIKGTSPSQQMSEALANRFKGTKVRHAKNLIMPNTDELTTSRSCISMFEGCTHLISAPRMEESGVGYRSYEKMFYGCTSLITAPDLPATTLSYRCYHKMFSGCTSLTTAPELSATTLAEGCCDRMFEGCTSLRTAPKLPALELSKQCYDFMFSGCTSLATAPELPATTLAEYCYSGMFTSCSSLKEPPKLPAIELADSCYTYMFQGCMRLNSVPDLPSIELNKGCYMHMFQGCHSIKVSPKLHAKVLKEYCYCGMFQGCINMVEITCLAEDISAQSCLDYWVNNITTNGTFYKSPNMTSLPIGTNGVPESWTIQDYAE